MTIFFRSKFSPGNPAHVKSQFAFPQQTKKTDYTAKQHGGVSPPSHSQHGFPPQFLPADSSPFPSGVSLPEARCCPQNRTPCPYAATIFRLSVLHGQSPEPDVKGSPTVTPGLHLPAAVIHPDTLGNTEDCEGRASGVHAVSVRIRAGIRTVASCVI